MTDSFMQNHQSALDSQREDDAIQYLQDCGVYPDPDNDAVFENLYDEAYDELSNSHPDFSTDTLKNMATRMAQIKFEELPDPDDKHYPMETEDEDNFLMEINPNLEKIRLPIYWASYLANGVEDSLEDGEKETIQDVLDSANLSDHTCVDVLDDANFELAPSWYPSLLAGDYCTYVFDKF